MENELFKNLKAKKEDFEINFETDAKKKDENQKENDLKKVDLKKTGNEILLADILEAALDFGASDIHFATDEKIAFRINGEIVFVKNFPPLSKENAEKMAFSLLRSDHQREILQKTRELDTAYEHLDGTSFRVNLYFKRNRIAAALRVIASEPWTMEDLGIPIGIKKLISSRQGLLLVTGPTGSGKSTSMQSMLEHINETRVEHILTIEDPIEFIFESKKSIFSQREIGADTLSFKNSLRAALREDPDIVMIGEMRDAETIMAAMNLAETGHLVISTLHTSGAPQTISRIINAFPPDEQYNVQNRLADSLIGVLSQRLVRRADRKGRLAIFELMIVDGAIRNIIRTNDLGQLPNAIMAGKRSGMVLMEHYARALEEKGIIREEDYIHFFREE